MFNKPLSGASIIYQHLLYKKVNDVFLYSGGAIMPLIDKFYEGPINYYINTHEQSAGHAATGYAKSTDKTGVAIVTSGPGLTNMVTPLLDATNDSTPFVLFSGQVSTVNMGTNAFQECPATEITKPVTKWSYCVESVNELDHVIDYAFDIANRGKKGSVHIDLPKDVLVDTLSEPRTMEEEIMLEHEALSNISSVSTTSKIMPLPPAPSLQSLGEIINNAKRPVFYIGQGCNPYSDILRDLVKTSNIPITTTIHAMGVYDEADHLSLQFLGMHGHAAANYAIQESDCIIAIGSRFDDRTTGAIKKYAPEAFRAYSENRGGIIHCNIEQGEISKNVASHYNYHMDAGIFMIKLAKYLSFKERPEWLNMIALWKENYPFQVDPAGQNKIKTQEVIQEISDQVVERGLADRTIYTSGVGNHQMMAAQFIQWKYPKTFLSSGSLGVMGVGLPYAIGAQIANPAHIIIDIDGDGSFNHTLSELKTLVEYNLPIKVAIMNDKSLSMVRVWEELFFEERYTATASEKNPDYVKLAESYGIKAIRCDSYQDLPDMVGYFLEYSGPIVADFRVEKDQCLPLVAPGKGLDEMILPETQVIVPQKNQYSIQDVPS